MPLLAIQLDSLVLPWGLTFQEAAAHLAGHPHYEPVLNSAHLRVACHRAYNLATTEVSLRASAPHRPVTRVGYELAAVAEALPDELRAGGPWRPELERQFGPPATTESAPENWGQPAREVWTGRWQLPQLGVLLVVYGGPRDSPGGPVAAALYLSWLDVVTAAQPWVVRAQHQTAGLAAVTDQAQALLLVTLAERQFACCQVYANSAAPNPEAEAEAQRLAQRALTREQLCDTPPRWQQLLSDYQVLLWVVPGQDAWAVSTRSDTVLVPALGPPPIELLLVHPARGGGNVFLTIGDLWLHDAYQSAGLRTLADQLAALPGVHVSRGETLDC